MLECNINIVQMNTAFSAIKLLLLKRESREMKEETRGDIKGQLVALTLRFDVTLGMLQITSPSLLLQTALNFHKRIDMFFIQANLMMSRKVEKL